jgi:hypothetical protein
MGFMDPLLAELLISVYEEAVQASLVSTGYMRWVHVILIILFFLGGFLFGLTNGVVLYKNKRSPRRITHAN